MSKLDKHILLWARKAIQLSKERFNQEIELSERGLSSIESVLSQIEKLLQQSEVKQTQTIRNLAYAFGALIGEIIRREIGGVWVLPEKKQIPYLIVGGDRVSPMGYVGKRLMQDIQMPVEEFFMQLKRKAIASTEQESLSEGHARRGNDKVGRAIMLGLLGVVILCFLGALLHSAIRSYQSKQRFKTDLETFLQQGDKLNYLTEQGVSYMQFKDQLVEVKVSYRAIGEQWPDSLALEKQFFEQAIEGWDLTLEVWEYKLSGKGYPDPSLAPSLAKDIGQYLGQDAEEIEAVLMFPNLIDDVISTLMTQAAIYYEKGRRGANRYLGK